MDNIDNRFIYYRRLKKIKRFFFFGIGFAIPLIMFLFYLYEWNRMPEVIYLQSGEEQVIDFGVPVKGLLYKEGEKIVSSDSMAVESISNANLENESIEVDFSKELVFEGVGEGSYYAELKLFGILPYKTVHVESVDTYEVIPSGETIGIYVKMDGVYVIDTGDFQSMEDIKVDPCKNRLKPGDYIIAVNGEKVTRKKDFMGFVQKSEGKTLSLTVMRNEKELKVDVTPVLALDGDYKIGVWVRDSLQGVGTLTFIDADGDYGALGHAVRDADTNEVVSISDGALYETSIVSIHRGEKGEPGEITGLIKYDPDKQIAEIDGNTVNGIYGYMTNDAWINETNAEPMEIALKQEVELGEATIISAISGERKEYNVKIIEINYNVTENKKAMTIEVTDPELLELTGGIIQGMFMSYNGYNTRKTQ